MLLAHSLYISGPDCRRNLSDNLNSCHCSYWAEPSLQICWSVYEWASWIGAYYSTFREWPPYTPSFTAVSQELLQPRGMFPVCSVPRVVMGSVNICSWVPEWDAFRLLSPDSDGLVHVLNQNWKNKITPNCRRVLKSLVDKVNSELFGFH